MEQRMESRVYCRPPRFGQVASLGSSLSGPRPQPDLRRVRLRPRCLVSRSDGRKTSKRLPSVSRSRPGCSRGMPLSCASKTSRSLASSHATDASHWYTIPPGFREPNHPIAASQASWRLFPIWKAVVLAEAWRLSCGRQEFCLGVAIETVESLGLCVGVGCCTFMPRNVMLAVPAIMTQC